MALPKGWHSAQGGREKATIYAVEGGSPGRYVETVTADEPEEGKNYPRLSSVGFVEIEGWNLKRTFHSQNNQRQMGITVEQEDTDSDAVGVENYARVRFVGRDADNKYREWDVYVHSDLCPAS